MQRPHVADARSIRNAIDRARLRQATRLLERCGALPRDDLVVSEADEIPAGRVFRVGIEATAEEREAAS